MSPWLDGLNALSAHAWAAAVVVLAILWGIIVVRSFLQHALGDKLSEADILTISAAGWVIPLLFLSLSVFTVSLLFTADIGRVFAIIIVCGSSLFSFRKKFEFFTAILLLLLVGGTIILRFAFLKDTFLPLYFDSAEHYRLIKSIIEISSTGMPSEEFSTTFYHLGFHYVAAFFSFFPQVDALDFMLVFGQNVLALLIFPLFFIVRRETNSISSAVFTCLISTFGFHMPAHLLNWGKYPALLGLISMLFFFDIYYVLYRNDVLRFRRSLLVLLVVSLFVSLLIHSRTFFIFISMFVAVVVSFWWKHLRLFYRVGSFFVVIVALVVLLSALQNNVEMNLLLESYFHNDLWILLLVFTLTIVSAFYYTTQTFFLVVWITFCIFCMFIPVTLPVLGVQTLLDRPFVQMFMVVPLSILGGLGLSSLVELLRSFNANPKIFQPLITFILVGAVVSNVAVNYRFYPSPCCRFVTRDDLAAFSWVEQSVSVEKKILIASSKLYVNSFEKRNIPVGLDAGIWIPSLLSRKVEFEAQDIRFDVRKTHSRLCARGIDYIYIGGMPQSFNPLQLEKRPDWYSPSFVLPSAKIYQVIGCDR